MASERQNDWHLYSRMEMAQEDARIAQLELEAYEKTRDAQTANIAMGGLVAFSGILLEHIPGMESSGTWIKWGGALLATAGAMAWQKAWERIQLSQFQNPDL